MNNTDKLDNLVVELSGIKDTLIMVTEQFNHSEKPCIFDNNTIAGTLNSIAYHIGRISDELDDLTIA